MTALDWLLIVLAIVVGAFAILGIVYCAVWLSIWHMKRTDPAAYERFRIIHNLRKGAWKR